jgi:hypothetical protein
MFKILREKASSIIVMHFRLISFGISTAIVTGLMIGLSALSDPSHMAHAVRKFEDWSR